MATQASSKQQKQKREKLPELRYPTNDNNNSIKEERVCQQCDELSDSLGRCPLSGLWFCDDQCRTEYRLEHPNLFAVKPAPAPEPTRKQKRRDEDDESDDEMMEEERPRKRDRGDENKKKKKKLDDRKEREKERRHNNHNGIKREEKQPHVVVLADTLPGPVYDADDAAKHRLRNMRQTYQQQQGKSGAAVNAQRVGNIQQERDAVLQVYKSQLRRLTDFRYHIQRAQPLWEETGLAGGNRAAQMESWVQFDTKRIAKLQSVHDDIAARYSDEVLGVKKATPVSLRQRMDLTSQDAIWVLTDDEDENAGPEEQDEDETELFTEPSPPEQPLVVEPLEQPVLVVVAAAEEAQLPQQEPVVAAEEAPPPQQEPAVDESPKSEVVSETGGDDAASEEKQATPKKPNAGRPRYTKKRASILSPDSEAALAAQDTPVRAIQMETNGGLIVWKESLPLTRRRIEGDGFRLHGQSSDKSYDLYCQTFRRGREPPQDEAHWGTFIEEQFGVRVPTEGDVLATHCDGTAVSEQLVQAARDYKTQHPPKAPRLPATGTKRRVLKAQNLSATENNNNNNAGKK